VRSSCDEEAVFDNLGKAPVRKRSRCVAGDVEASRDGGAQERRASAVSGGHGCVRARGGGGNGRDEA
jgi:hypothetical protein